MPIVDASVVVALVAPDAGDTETDVRDLWRRWADGGVELWAPPLLKLEVLNALLTALRGGRWEGAVADQARELVTTLPIGFQQTEADEHRAWELARRYDNWPVYDMVYLALAARLGGPLVTLDDRLLRRFAHLDLVVAPGDA